MLIKLWDWEKKWVCTQVFEGHTHYVMQIVINPKDNNTFASCSLDRTVKVHLSAVLSSVYTVHAAQYSTTHVQSNLNRIARPVSCGAHTHTHNHFTALWTLSGITRVSRYQKVHFAIFWRCISLSAVEKCTFNFVFFMFHCVACSCKIRALSHWL